MSLPAALLHYLCHFVVAIISVVSFGISFHVPRRHYLACGLTGAVGWIVYLLCLNLLQCTAPVSVLIATLPLTALARAFAIRHKAPLTVFLLSGIFPLVPGAGIYNTAYYFLQDDRALFANAGVETLKIALMLALGIALVCSVPLPQNHSTRK